MAMRPPFLTDSLPMDEWQRRRNLQAAGLEPVTLAPAARLSDDLPMDEWQRIRNLQAQGGDVISGSQGDEALAGGSGSDKLRSSTATSAKSTSAALAPDARRARALEYGADRVLDLISRGEGTNETGYDTVYGYDRYKPPGTPPLADLTLDQVAQLQKAMLDRGSGYTPVGKYQMTAATLTDFRRRLKLSGSEKFTPELQDRVAREILHDRGYDDFLARKISPQEFQRRLAKRWDSLSDLNGHPYSDRKSLKKAPRISSAEIQAILEAAEKEFNQGIDEGRLPLPPGGWR